MIKPDWIAVDWGTTNLRAWAMLEDGTVGSRAESALGMVHVEPGRFEATLDSMIGGWLTDDRSTQVIACGMVGADRGWVHAPYREAPCTPIAPGGFALAPVRDRRMNVVVVPGLMTVTPSPDVMRGEETQIAGLFSGSPEFHGIACLPGTHTKWVSVRSGQVAEFQTFMTGELFDILGSKSILRHSVDPRGWDEDAFYEAILLDMSDPGMIAARLFSLRSESLICGLEPAVANARLSGILIGAELASTRPLWQERDLIVVGSGKACSAYGSALRVLGKEFTEIDSEQAVTAGLGHARRMFGQMACPDG